MCLALVAAIVAFPAVAVAAETGCAVCHNINNNPHTTMTVHQTALDTCASASCHSSDVSQIHAKTQLSCAVCHSSASVAKTTDCSTAGCHATVGGHESLHGGIDAVDQVNITGIDAHWISWHYNCSDCHVLTLFSLHAKNCGACHADTAPAKVKTAVANNDTKCTSCHLGVHYDVKHGCQCHDIGNGYGTNDCSLCHAPNTPVANPVTTSDAKSAYISDATITLTPTDGYRGSFGIKATYYILDGNPQAAGTTVVVPAPASGTASHTLTFWSVDWSGNVEPKNTVSFTVTHDGVPPTTASNVTAGKAYTGNQTFTLTATDLNSPVAGTFWQLDGTAGAWTKGTSVAVKAPATGAAAHTLYFYSVDSVGNTEAVKSVAFSSVAGADFAFTGADQTFVVPAGVTKITVTLLGGAGGASPLSVGGNGGRVVDVLAVVPGSSYTVRVGGRGGATPSLGGGIGLPGWPNGGTAFNGGGGGGGSSSIWLGATEIAEAGGGGGAAYYRLRPGGAGGAQGRLPGGFQTGISATLTGSGAGGGGWNPGGAGLIASASGAGGTSYVAVGSGTLAAGANAGAGSILIRW